MNLEGEHNNFELDWTEWVVILFCIQAANNLNELELSFEVPLTFCGIEAVLIADSLQGFLRTSWELLAVENGLREFPDGRLANTGTDPKLTKPACYIPRKKFEEMLVWMRQCGGFIVDDEEA